LGVNVFFSEEIVVACPVERAFQGLSAWLGSDGGEGATTDELLAGRRVLLRAGFAWLDKTVEVRTLAPQLRDEITVMPMRWSATGHGGVLFPSLDANLEIAAAGPDQSRVALVGTYRPPLGPIGAGLDRAALHKAAQATVRRFLREARAAVTAHSAEVETTASLPKHT
jgi:hypothetical protein